MSLNKITEENEKEQLWIQFYKIVFLFRMTMSGFWVIWYEVVI